MVIWMTGLSGSGKSTIADAMVRELKSSMRELILLDGDVIRSIFGKSLDYSEPSRVIQVKRLRSMAKFLSEQGMVVIVSVLYCHPELMKWNRENISEYFEVYVDTSLDVVMQRDVKGLYKMALNGEMKHVVGLDIDWHPPKNPDVHIDGSSAGTPEEFARIIIENCDRLNIVTIKDSV